MSPPADALPPCLSIRKQNKLKLKKRKIEAFLNLVSGEKLDTNENAKKPKCDAGETKLGSLEEELRSLQRMMKAKQNEGEPSFFLTEHGIKAQVNFTFYNKENPLGQTLAPLFVEDVQHLLLRGVIRGSTAVAPRWGKIVRDRNLSHVLFFVIDGFSKDTIVNNVSLFPNMVKIFDSMVEVVSPDFYSLNFATELCGVHLSLGHREKPKENSQADQTEENELGACNSFKPLSTIFPTDETSSTVTTKSYSKLHLLLSPIQLVMENFPLPKSVFQGSKSEGYCFTKNIYSHVTSDSPLFALDCEMCRMRSGRMEVTRIAVIDEQYNVVYNTLVKPVGAVTDYLTKYSGVTKEMLASVKTTLEDVQSELQRLLPPDAILCGQSLNFDLHALKMIHPYVIDTSVIYNISGSRTKKAGLRVLSELFLNETIQSSEAGHDPIEDCIAAMKLVQLKLRNGPQFGDAILMGPKAFASMKELKKKSPKECKAKVEPKKSKKQDSDLSTSFFAKLLIQRKTCCICATADEQQHYSEEMVPTVVKRIIKQTPNKIIKHTIKHMDKFDLSICHLNVKSLEQENETYTTIDNYILRLYTACADKALFVAIVTGLGRKNSENVFENALCMVKVKNEKLSC